jgi:hypothetical protein
VIVITASGDLRATLAALTEGAAEAREAALAALKVLYVHCEGGSCTTDPEIASMALPPAMNALRDPDPGVRVTGARAIRLLASDGGAAIPSLMAALADHAVEVRLEVLGSLGEFGVAAAAAQPVGERLARGATVEERASAAYTLGNLGAPDEQIDLLIAALIGDEPAVQAGASHALTVALERGSAYAAAALRRLKGPTTV